MLTKQLTSLDDSPVRVAPDAIGPYQVIRQLGQGAVATVFLCSQETPHRSVAIKLFDATSTTRQKRFEREAHILGALDHPGIAKIFDYGRTEERLPYLVMEFVDGGTLGQYVESNDLNRQQKLELLKQLLDAIDHAHRNGVVHRDLKPANILVDRQRRIGVIDFGVAKLTNLSADTLTSREHLQEILGTLPFMAPEQIEGDSVDFRADLYSMNTETIKSIHGGGTWTISGSAVDFSSLEKMLDGATVVDGITQPFPSLAVVDGRSIVVNSGVVDLLRVVSYTNTRTDDVDRILRAEGAGSKLSMPNAKTLQDAANAWDDLFVEATDGGTVDFSSVLQVPDGAVLFRATGIGSRIELDDLQSFDGYFSRTDSGFRPSDGGVIFTPELTDIRDATISLNGTGAMDTSLVESILGSGTLTITGDAVDLSPLEQMQDGTTIVDGVNQPFPSLVVVDGRTIMARAGAVVSVPGAASYVNTHTDDNDRFLQAEGPGSQLLFPNVTTIQGASNAWDDLIVEAVRPTCASVDWPAAA